MHSSNEEAAIVNGAVPGIGRASAQFFAREGSKVAVSDHIEHPQARMSGEIERLIARNHTITIASTYKGLILTHPIRVLDILPDRVIFQAPEGRLCFTLREKVLLYIHTLPEAVTARLLELNMILGKISLSDFTFSGHNWKERLCERIQPRNLICVNFSSQKSTVRAHLDNLSATGMRLLISRTKDRGVYTDYGAPVRLAFQLPTDASEMELKGKLIFSRQVGNLVIVGVQFYPSLSQEKRLNQYILACKAEILNELELAFQKMLGPRQIHDLYF